MTERLLTARELADLLGFSPATVVDWAEAEKLPCFKIGGRLRFRDSEVLAWLEQQRFQHPLQHPFGYRPWYRFEHQTREVRNDQREGT